ncbi:MAG: hypothetical protein ACOYL6_17860 [Bacteriovoracaceae bacterium]
MKIKMLLIYALLSLNLMAKEKKAMSAFIEYKEGETTLEGY